MGTTRAEEAAVKRIQAGFGMVIPQMRQDCQIAGRNGDGDLLVNRTFPDSPSARVHRYIIGKRGAIKALGL